MTYDAAASEAKFREREKDKRLFTVTLTYSELRAAASSCFGYSQTLPEKWARELCKRVLDKLADAEEAGDANTD